LKLRNIDDHLWRNNILEKKTSKLYLIVLISILVLLSSIHLVYFPVETEEGILFSGEVDDQISLSEIYQNLSGEGFKLENVTGSVVIEDCSQGTCEIDFEDVEQLKVTSEDWEELRTVLIWENTQGMIEFKGNSSMEVRHLLDINLISRNSEMCKESVTEFMGLAGVDIEERDVKTNPSGIFASIPICFGMVLLIVSFFALLLVIVLDEKKEDKEDYSLEKMLSFIAVPGLFMVLIHAFRVSGYTSAAASILWVLPFTLVIMAVLLFVPWEYKHGKFLIIGLVGFLMYLVYATTQNPHSSCFICCISIPLVGMIIVFAYLLIRDMENE